MSKTLKASVVIPPGYRLLRANTIQQKGDRQLIVHTPGVKRADQIGGWEPTDSVGYRADWGDNMTIRPIKS